MLAGCSGPGCWLELVGSVTWRLVCCAATHLALRALRPTAQHDAAAVAGAAADPAAMEDIILARQQSEPLQNAPHPGWW